MRNRNYKKINNRIENLNKKNVMIELKTKFVYKYIWKQILKNISTDGIDIKVTVAPKKKEYFISLLEPDNLSLADNVVVDKEKLIELFKKDGFDLKKINTSSYGTIEYQIKYSIDELKNIIDNNGIDYLPDEIPKYNDAKEITYSKKTKIKNILIKK